MFALETSVVNDYYKSYLHWKLVMVKGERQVKDESTDIFNCFSRKLVHNTVFTWSSFGVSIACSTKYLKLEFIEKSG
ncbi:unnamed protein product [Rhizophagus irregularis]|nr:unnamed protein product [Rhizophagus irregularis]